MMVLLLAPRPTYRPPTCFCLYQQTWAVSGTTQYTPLPDGAVFVLSLVHAHAQNGLSRPDPHGFLHDEVFLSLSLLANRLRRPFSSSWESPPRRACELTPILRPPQATNSSHNIMIFVGLARPPVFAPCYAIAGDRVRRADHNERHYSEFWQILMAKVKMQEIKRRAATANNMMTRMKARCRR
jgi:hypothetical protein